MRVVVHVKATHEFKPRNWRAHGDKWLSAHNAIIDAIYSTKDIGYWQLVAEIAVGVKGVRILWILPKTWDYERTRSTLAEVEKRIEDALVPICGERWKLVGDDYIEVDNDGMPLAGKPGTFDVSEPAGQYESLAAASRHGGDLALG